MKMQVLKPKNPVVGGIVESYLHVETAGYTELNTFPNGRVDASIVLNGELEWFTRSKNKFETLSAATFYPLTQTVGKVRSKKYLRCVGVKFYPHILSWPVFENRKFSEPFAFDEIFNASHNRQMINKLLNAGDFPDIVQVLDSYFFEKLFTKATPDRWLLQATHAIESEIAAQVKMIDIARNMGISIKTLERRFQRTIGLSPKSFSSIIQLHQATSNIRKKGPVLLHGNLIDALDHGYYDQSHFIKSCLRITGLTPKKFLTGLPTQATDLMIVGASRRKYS